MLSWPLAIVMCTVIVVVGTVVCRLHDNMTTIEKARENSKRELIRNDGYALMVKREEVRKAIEEVKNRTTK